METEIDNQMLKGLFRPHLSIPSPTHSHPNKLDQGKMSKAQLFLSMYNRLSEQPEYQQRRAQIVRGRVSTMLGWTKQLVRRESSHVEAFPNVVPEQREGNYNSFASATDCFPLNLCNQLQNDFFTFDIHRFASLGMAEWIQQERLKQWYSWVYKFRNGRMKQRDRMKQCYYEFAKLKRKTTEKNETKWRLPWNETHYRTIL